MLIADDRKFTLLIPTFNGSKFLRRTLDYLKDQQYPGRIVIADDSSGEERRFVESVRDNYPELWMEVQLYEKRLPFLRKLCRSLESATSEFVMLHAQDDFVVAEGAEACVRHLDTHADYSAARGRVSMFAMQKKLRSDGSNSFAMSFVSHPMRAYLDDNPVERMLDHINRYASCLYSVHRRKQLLESLARTERDTQSVIFFQYLSSAVTALLGKIACLEQLFYVRHGHPESWSAQLRASGDPEHWPWLITSPNFSRYYGEFKASLVSLANEKGLGVPQLDAKIDEASVGLFQRGFCGREGENPGEVAFFNKLNDPTTKEHQQVRAIAAFCSAYPDTY